MPSSKYLCLFSAGCFNYTASEKNFTFDEFHLYKTSFTPEDATELYENEKEDMTDVCEEKKVEETHPSKYC